MAAAAIAGGQCPPRAPAVDRSARLSCRCGLPAEKTLTMSGQQLHLTVLDLQSSRWSCSCASSVRFRRNALFTRPRCIGTFGGYSFLYPKSRRGHMFPHPFVLDENMSVEISSPSSSKYATVEDLGPPEKAAQRVLKQYLTECMSTRLGVRRESNVSSASSKLADNGKLRYEVEVNMKSYASNNELAVMPQDRVQRLEWDRQYLSVVGVENKRLCGLRLQSPEQVFMEGEDLRTVMASFRAIKTAW